MKKIIPASWQEGNSMLLCPKCGKVAVSTKTEYGLRNHCSHCNMWSWGNNSPLVSKATHSARQGAHKSFDIIWESRFMTRADSYEWLAKSLGISSKDCHMKKMNFETANKVIQLCRFFSQIGKS